MRQSYDEIPEYTQHADNEHDAETQYQANREKHDRPVRKNSQ
jgi:hypothetical protein